MPRLGVFNLKEIMTKQNGTNTTAAPSPWWQQPPSPEQETLVEVTLPSGRAIMFAKPSKFTMMFKIGIVPQAGASGAVEKWIEAGLIKPGDFTSEQSEQIDIGLELRNQVLLLSRMPKLVVGTPKAPDEYDVLLLPEADIEYLLAWVGAGGSAVNLGKFPQRSEPNALASSVRKKRRAKAK